MHSNDIKKVKDIVASVAEQLAIAAALLDEECPTATEQRMQVCIRDAEHAVEDATTICENWGQE